ncbi:MAG: GTPase HflX, partial [Pseudomonadales bacterium]|nr:GTPase HflX [Pseudomonadales bacterium]
MFFERADTGERAVLVHIDFPESREREDPLEFELLAVSAGADPICVVTGSRRGPDPRYFVGTGKVEEIAGIVRDECAELVLFNHRLSPSQERNLEKVLECRVLDRTGLILDIFAQRARTFEGKLQVELAQLQHLSTRLVRRWTHLERQKGGIGLRGPGETQLESDRRMVRDRIKAITRRLDKVRKQRNQGRRSRQRADIPTLSLVGYTNAGKSTLFNHMTGSCVYAADKLFATLDPTLRRLQIADVGQVVLADTVGFIRHLPHQVVDAFRATLEETCEADLLLHVIDASGEEREDNIVEVESVLKEIEADQIPRLEIYNKIDLLELSPKIERDELGKPVRVWVSAAKEEGLELIFQAISELLVAPLVEKTLCLSPDQGRLRSAFYQRQAVVSENCSEGGDF